MQHPVRTQILVMPGLDPGIQGCKTSIERGNSWIAGSSPAMTKEGKQQYEIKSRI